MRLLLPLLYLFSAFLVHSRDVSNPLMTLMDSRTSKDVKEFVSQIFFTISQQVTMVAIGAPPSLEDFKKDIANITVTFFMLPLNDQRAIYDKITTIANKAKSSGQISMPGQMDEATAELELLNRRLNTPAAFVLLEEIDEKFDLITQTDEALDYISSKDPELGEMAKKIVREGREQYELLGSDEAKAFVWKSFEYLEANEKTNTKEKAFNHLRDEFIKLDRKDQIDVVYRMTWFLHPIWESTHKQLIIQGQKLIREMLK